MFRFCRNAIIVIYFGLTFGSLKSGYDNLQWGKRLIGGLLTTITQISPLDCAEECLIRPGCLSFNYRRAAIFCELNYKNNSNTDAQLSEDSGWIFSLRETWPMDLVGICKDTKCALNEKCERKAFGESICNVSHCHPKDLIISSGIKPFRSNIALDFGSSHELSCVDGYTEKGDNKVKCLWNGKWSRTDIICEKPFNKCFYTITGRKTYNEAKKACKEDKGYLLEVQAEGEAQFIREEAINLRGKSKCTDKPVLPVWLGIEGKKGYLHWIESGGIVTDNITWENINKNDDFSIILLNDKMKAIKPEDQKCFICEKDIC